MTQRRELESCEDDEEEAAEVKGAETAVDTAEVTGLAGGIIQKRSKSVKQTKRKKLGREYKERRLKATYEYAEKKVNEEWVAHS